MHLEGVSSERVEDVAAVEASSLLASTYGSRQQVGDGHLVPG